MSERSAWRHLRRLSEDGIATSEAGVWALVPNVEDTLLWAQARRGTLGTTAWQQAIHREEREVNRRNASRYMRELRAEALTEAQASRFAPTDLVAEGGEAAWREFIAGASRKHLIGALVGLRRRLRSVQGDQVAIVILGEGVRAA